MKVFEMQVYAGPEGKKDWVSVKCTGSKIPYRYLTRVDASSAIEICYPDECRDMRLGDDPTVRVFPVEVNEGDPDGFGGELHPVSLADLRHRVILWESEKTCERTNSNCHGLDSSWKHHDSCYMCGVEITEEMLKENNYVGPWVED